MVRTLPASAATVAKDVVKGFVVGSDAKSSAAQVAGDIASSVLVVGDVRDLFVGLAQKDPVKVSGALLGLVPAVGDGASVAVKGGKKVATVVGKEIAEQGVKKGAQALATKAASTTAAAMRNPAVRAQLQQAGERGMARGMEILHERLASMQASGQAPDVAAHQHKSFMAARDAAFEAIGKPDPSWSTLRTDGGAVGKHKDGRRGFQLVFDQALEKPELHVAWWRQGRDDSVKFGVESFPGTPADADRILSAYLRNEKR